MLQAICSYVMHSYNNNATPEEEAAADIPLMSQFIGKLNSHQGNIVKVFLIFFFRGGGGGRGGCFHLWPQQYDALTHELQARCVYKATVCNGDGSQENTSGVSVDAAAAR